MANGVEEVGPSPRPSPGPLGKLWVFHVEDGLGRGSPTDARYQGEESPFFSLFAECFGQEWMLTLPNAFLCLYFEIIITFSSF